ncbi:MAG TPA: DUF2804 family protein [Herpetosiphonaceae bacterium]|nr:DUF2804 family protein [Herpetosiphonaceae bacterium]
MLKRWRYVSIWSANLSICVGSVQVGPAQQEFWAIWDRAAGKLRERTRLRRRYVELTPGRVRVRDQEVDVDITLDEHDGVEVVTYDGGAYTWTRKQIVRAHGVVRIGERTLPVEATALIDDNAGYHRRHTAWHWSGGAGTTIDGRGVAWSVIVGLNDSIQNSERTVWLDGVPREVEPVRFAHDLSTVEFATGEMLEFKQEAVRQRRDNLLLIRSRYRQPFGTFRGTLPGNVVLREAYGVMEEHVAVW